MRRITEDPKRERKVRQTHEKRIDRKIEIRGFKSNVKWKN
jgi:hypothetical protein